VGDGHQKVVLQMKLNSVRSDEQSLERTRENGSGLTDRVTRIRHDGVLGNRADARD
jgi:hypothetical protein